MTRFAHRGGERPSEQDQHGADEACSDHECGEPDDDVLPLHGCEETVHYHEMVPDTRPGPDSNYSSGNDYVVEFLGYRFSFSATDFEGRVVAAAVKLGVVET